MPIHTSETDLLQDSVVNQKPIEAAVKTDGFMYPAAALFDSFSLAANLMVTGGANAAAQQNILSMLCQQPATAHPPTSSTPNSTEDSMNDLAMEVGSFLMFSGVRIYDICQSVHDNF